MLHTGSSQVQDGPASPVIGPRVVDSPGMSAIVSFLRSQKGLFWALAAVVCWGAMFPVGDTLMQRGSMTPESVAMFRFLFASPLLLAMAVRSHGRAALPNGARDWAHLAALGLVGSAAMAAILFEAQRTVAPVNASLMEAYVPMQVLLLGIFAGRLPTGRQTASIALGFLGSLLVLQAVDGGGLRLGVLRRGDLLVFLSGLCWAVYTAWGRPLATRLGGLPFTAWTVLFGGVWLLVLHLLRGDVPTPPRTTLEWRCLLFLAVFPTGVAFFGWNEAQKTVSLARLSFLEYFTPLVAAVCGVVFLRKGITTWQWLGIALVIASARLLPSERPNRKSPEPSS